MMPDFVPSDPRQIETHRLLRLIGGEPAAFFLDACRLMAGDPTLIATTHLVGHLMRELDSALSGVLRPMVPPDRWPEQGSEDAHRRKIDAICDALRVDADDAFRKAWREYATGLHRRAHRRGLAAPRPVDSDFRELWELGQAVILRLAQRIESNFTQTLSLIDRLASGTPDLSTLRHHVPHSTVALDRFFERAGLAWLEPLRSAGYFSDPPPLVYNEDGSVGYARWPQGRYLARVAAEAPGIVIGLGVGLETDNPEAQEAFVEAACAVLAQKAAPLVPTVERWLETPAQWALPMKVRDLIGQLVAGGDVENGIRLLRALLATERPGQRDGLAGQLLSELAPEIFPAAGLSGLEALVEILAEHVAAESHGEQDHSYIWRPSLETDRYRDLRDQLVTAVRDATDVVVGEDEANLGPAVALLEAHRWSIFGRLALDLLARHGDADLIAERLTNRDVFDDLAYEREYTALASQHFGRLAPGRQAEILGWIDAAERLDDDEAARRAWQRRMLERLGRPLPGEWEARYRELAGAAEPEPRPLRESGWVGPSSPIGQTELAEMSIAEIVAMLTEWRPEADWRAPSPEGLSRTLREVVAADPERFAIEAMAFADVDPTYVRAFFGGLREAHQNGSLFPWPEVLALAYTIVDRPREIEGRDAGALGDLDPGWVWTWLESLHVLARGLARGEGRIPSEHRELVWRLIERHADDPNPTLESEEDGEFDPATRSLHSIRGMAMRAAVTYGAWVRADDGEEAERLPPELEALLERHIDPEAEPTATIRSVFGQWFPSIAALDERWAAARAGQVFPREGDDRLWRASWHAYVRSNHAYAGVYPLLRVQYRRAIEELEAPEGESGLQGDVGEALVSHLMELYSQGVIAFGDEGGLLDRFYQVATVERRAQAIDAIGHGIADANELSGEVTSRLRSLLELRIDAVRDGSDGEELRGFAWWFASGKFDAEWSLARLQEVLEVGGRLHPDHVVAKRLAALREEHLHETVRALEALIEAETRPWFPLAARDEIAAILADGLAAGGDSEGRSRDIVNRLVARGHRDFEGLLPE
jgi:hypothetical protein